MNRQLDPQRDAKPGMVTHAEAQSTTIPSGRMYQMARPAPEASWRVIRQRETRLLRGWADPGKESNERHSGHGEKCIVADGGCWGAVKIAEKSYVHGFRRERMGAWTLDCR
jgi:hypothetical protein